MNKLRVNKYPPSAAPYTLKPTQINLVVERISQSVHADRLLGICRPHPLRAVIRQVLGAAGLPLVVDVTSPYPPPEDTPLDYFGKRVPDPLSMPTVLKPVPAATPQEPSDGPLITATAQVSPTASTQRRRKVIADLGPDQ